MRKLALALMVCLQIVGATAMRPIKWYEERSRWSALRALGTSPLVRLSILTPFAGYFILLNQQMLQYADIDPRFKLVASEWPWRLLLFYFGTFFTGAASAIFVWRCPGVISRYVSAVDYTNAESAFFAVQTHQGPLLSAVNDAWGLPEWQKSQPALTRVWSFSFNETAQGSDLLEVMTMFWHVRDMEQTGWRVACRTLFDFGLILLAVPALATFAGVVSYAVGRIRLN